MINTEADLINLIKGIGYETQIDIIQDGPKLTLIILVETRLPRAGAMVCSNIIRSLIQINKPFLMTIHLKIHNRVIGGSPYNYNTVL